jgi:hypothetical protein
MMYRQSRCKITDSIRSFLMSKRIAAFFVLALLISLNYIQGCAQSGTMVKRFVIWDERGKFGYMDETGRVAIKPQFDRAYPFTEGLAAVSIGDKAGFIDTLGKVVVPLQYYVTYPFSDGVAAVSLVEGDGNRRSFPCGYIDHTNQFVIKPRIKFSCTEFHEGFAVVEEYDSSLGESYATYLNKQGLTGVAGHLSVGKPFSGGLALIEDFSKWSFVNAEGQTVIDLRPKGPAHPLADQYEPASSFSEGLAMVGITTGGSAGYSRYAFMNRRGRIVFKLADNVTADGDFYDGRAQVYVAKSQTVRVHIDDEVIKMEEDVSARGYIDKTGKLAIPARFSRAEDFSEGLAVVRVGKGLPIDDYNITPERWKEYADNEAKYYSCIDRLGRVIVAKCGEPLAHEELVQKFSSYGRAFGRGFVDGLYFNKTHDGRQAVYGYQNRTGKYVWIQPHGPSVVTPGTWRE